MHEHEYQPLLDSIYLETGGEVEGIKTNMENRRYDVRLRMPDGRVWRIEEKGLKKKDALAFEIIQYMEDLASARQVGATYQVPERALGNQFTSTAEVQIWVCGETLETCTIYQVATIPLHSYILNKKTMEKYRRNLRIYTPGGGITIFLTVPWCDLLERDIAKAIYDNGEYKNGKLQTPPSLIRFEPQEHKPCQQLLMFTDVPEGGEHGADVARAS